MNTSRHFSLGTQLAWRGSILSVIAFIGIVVSVYIALLSALTSNHRILQSTVHDMSHDLDTFLSAIQSDTVSTAANIPYSYNTGQVLTQLLRRHEGILCVHLVTHDGQNILERRRMQMGSDEPLFFVPPDAPVTNNVIWTDVYSSENGVPLVDIAVPVYIDEDNMHMIQFLVVTLDLTGFWQDIRAVSVGRNGYAYLATQEGLLLTYKDITLVQEGVNVGNITGQEFTTWADTQPTLRNSLHNGLQQSWVLSNRENLDTRPWTLVIEEPITDIFSNLYGVFAMSVLVIGVIVAVILNIGHFTYTRIVFPLVTLQNGVRQFQRGALDWRIHLDTKHQDEITDLANILNQMATSIQQRTDELQFATAKAVESSRLKSEFLSTISHELRTPLNAIIGYSDLLLEGLAGNFDDETRRMLTSIRSSGERLLGLIDNLLDLSRIEAGKIETVLEPFEPHVLAEKWRIEHRPEAERKNLQLNVDIDPNLPQTLYGDSGQITQIVTNLLSNALKFTSEGHIELILRKHRMEWSITVKDTGIGIPQQAFKHIFQAFHQVDSSTRREYGGTGLGLSIVRNLVNLMGGRLDVQSEEGTGSEFTVYLPLITQPTDMHKSQQVTV